MTNSVTAHHIPSMVFCLVLLSYIPYTEIHDPKIHKSLFLQPKEWGCNWYKCNWHLFSIDVSNNFLFKKCMVVFYKKSIDGLLKNLEQNNSSEGAWSSSVLLWVFGVWDTYVCKHTHYKGKSRECRDCLIHQGMNFFLVQTSTIISVNPSQPLPKKEINPLISLGWLMDRNHII